MIGWLQMFALINRLGRRRGKHLGALRANFSSGRF